MGAVEEASEYVQRNQSRFPKATILDLVVRLGIAHLKSGDEQLAERHFQMARKIEPKTVGPEIEQGKLNESRGDHQAAKEIYQVAFDRNPSSPQVLNNLAWLLATSPDDQVRDGDKALRLATQASRITGNRHPGILDTLAAALAERQRWDEAIQVATRAESVARQMRLFQLANEVSGRLALYERQTPVRDAN
jgi:tetratricopeptide (TPR) repeat protein